MREPGNGREALLDRLSADEKEIRELLRGARQELEVPADDFAAISAAARFEWRKLVEIEGAQRSPWREQRWLALAAGLLLAAATAWLWNANRKPTPTAIVATVELAGGELFAERTLEGEVARWAPAGGTALAAETELETSASSPGSTPFLALRLAGGQSVRLDSDSRVRLASSRRLDLLRGAVYVDSGAGASGKSALEVWTSVGTVTEIGTQFEVRIPAGAPAVRVRVREGRIAVASGAGRHLASAGEELAVGRDGVVARATVDPHLSEWAWALAAAPAPAIEGQPLRSYLDWVARELALRLRFEDEELQRDSRSTRLHGAIAGLTPEESLDVVLPGSGLDYRIEDGELRVQRPSSEDAVR